MASNATTGNAQFDGNSSMINMSMDAFFDGLIGPPPEFPVMNDTMPLFPALPPCSAAPEHKGPVLAIQLAAAFFYWVFFFLRTDIMSLYRSWIDNLTGRQTLHDDGARQRRPIVQSSNMLAALNAVVFTGICLPSMMALNVVAGQRGLHTHIACETPLNFTGITSKLPPLEKTQLLSFFGQDTNPIELKLLADAMNSSILEKYSYANTSCVSLMRQGRELTPFDEILSQDVPRQMVALGRDVLWLEWNLIFVPLRYALNVLMIIFHFFRHFGIVLRLMCYIAITVLLPILLAYAFMRLYLSFLNSIFVGADECIGFIGYCILQLGEMLLRMFAGIMYYLWRLLVWAISLLRKLMRFIQDQRYRYYIMYLLIGIFNQMWNTLVRDLGHLLRRLAELIGIWWFGFNASLFFALCFFLTVHLQAKATSEVFCVVSPVFMLLSSMLRYSPQLRRLLWFCLLWLAPIGQPLLYGSTMYILKAAVYYALFPGFQLLGWYRLDFGIAYCLNLPHFGTIPIIRHMLEPALAYALVQLLTMPFVQWTEPSQMEYLGLISARKAWLLEQSFSSVFAVIAVSRLQVSITSWCLAIWITWALTNIVNIMLVACGCVRLESSMCCHVSSTLILIFVIVLLPCLLPYGKHTDQALLVSGILNILSCLKCILKLKKHQQYRAVLQKWIACVFCKCCMSERQFLQVDHDECELQTLSAATVPEHPREALPILQGIIQEEDRFLERRWAQNPATLEPPESMDEGVLQAVLRLLAEYALSGIEGSISEHIIALGPAVLLMREGRTVGCNNWLRGDPKHVCERMSLNHLKMELDQQGAHIVEGSTGKICASLFMCNGGLTGDPAASQLSRVQNSVVFLVGSDGSLKEFRNGSRRIHMHGRRTPMGNYYDVESATFLPPHPVGAIEGLQEVIGRLDSYESHIEEVLAVPIAPVGMNQQALEALFELAVEYARNGSNGERRGHILAIGPARELMSKGTVRDLNPWAGNTELLMNLVDHVHAEMNQDGMHIFDLDGAVVASKFFCDCIARDAEGGSGAASAQALSQTGCTVVFKISADGPLKEFREGVLHKKHLGNAPVPAER